MISLIDTHSHLDFPEFDKDRDDVILRAENEGIGCIINVGSSLEGSEKSLELARAYPCIYASVGIHPHEADNFDIKVLEDIKKMADNDKVVAIGEIGLDYYRNFSAAENQKYLFRSLADLAKDMNLPVVIHSRQAEADVLDILKPILPHKIVVHCFSGDEDFLKSCLDLGFFISFTCNITYKKAENLRRIVKSVPLERIFLETDAPFLPPEGFRGKRNEPFYVKHLAGEIAGIKGSSIEEVAEITTNNARKFFNLK